MNMRGGHPPGPDICDGLRQLGAGGMEIYIGTTERDSDSIVYR
jgi:hypothetical protein